MSSFNLFRISGDLLHLASILILLAKILSARSVAGISLKTQFLYALVFVTRYLDLFYNFASMYNWFMKIFFISSSCYIVYLMKFKRPFNQTYDAKTDTFNILYLIAPCAVLGLLINEYFTLTEILWSFSIYLEAVAIVPQLIVVHKYAAEHGGFVGNLTSHYVFTLGGYRVLYLFNWVWRFATEGTLHWIAVLAGLVQTAMYGDFFYYYIKAQFSGKQMSLPM